MDCAQVGVFEESNKVGLTKGDGSWTIPVGLLRVCVCVCVCVCVGGVPQSSWDFWNRVGAHLTRLDYILLLHNNQTVRRSTRRRMIQQ